MATVEAGTFNNQRELALKRTEKLIRLVQNFLKLPVVAEAADSWSRRAFDDFAKNWESDPQKVTSTSRELELRCPLKGSSLSARVSFSFKDTRNAPEPDGRVTGVEALQVGISYSGLYTTIDLLTASEYISWMTLINDSCSAALANEPNRFENYVWCDAEQAARRIVAEEKLKNETLIAAAIRKDAKGARKGSMHRFRTSGLPAGTYDTIVVDYYGGKLQRTFRVHIYTDGSGYFVRKT